MSSRSNRTIRLALSVFILSMLTAAAPPKVRQYVLTVGNEEFRFEARPELGYVVKTRQDMASIDALAGMLKDVGAVDISPIRGLGRKGVCVVYSARSADENEKTLKRLRSRSEVQYAAPLFSSNGETVAIIPEIVVRAKPGTDIEQVQMLCEGAGCTINKRMEFTEQEYLLEVLGPDAEAVLAAVGELGQAPCVEWACPNTAFQPKLCSQAVSGGPASDEQLRIDAAGQDANTPGVFPNDEYFPMQWHLYNTGQSGGTPGADIRAPEAWEITTGDPNIVVAVLDCGVDTNHPDLINNLVAGYDFYENDPFPDPALVGETNLHGTACAGLVAAQGNNSIGVTGVTWNCKVMPIRQTQIQPNPATEDVGATALRWAAVHGADIVNGRGATDYPTPIIHSAIVDITKPGGIGRNGKGCVLVYPAVNANSLVYYPARYPEVIAVGATDHQDLRWGYSNYGPDLDIMAPGGPYPPISAGDVFGVWTTDIAGSAGGNGIIRGLRVTDYIPFGGTSAAAPIVAGVAALILSVEPNLTNGEVRHFLEWSAKDLGAPGRDDYYGWGRVDARAALDMVLAKRADLNDDWKVDLEDLLILIGFWGTAEPSADIAPATRRDGIVDIQDLELMMQHWQEQIPELGLIARWKLDETEGIVAHNSVGDKDGFLFGGPLWRPSEGKKGGALEFDGIDDHVISTSVLNPADGPFSVVVWIQGGAPGDVIISQIDGIIAGNGATWLGAEAGSGKLMTALVPPLEGRFIPQPLKSQAVITDGQWHHIGFVWNGSYRSLYVDGVEVAKDAAAQASLKYSNGGLHIGVSKTLDAASFFSGLIDDLRIYNTALRADKIEALAR